MSENKPFVKEGSMFADEYRTDCSARKMLPFIKSRRHISIIIFSPDMADIYYKSELGVINE